MLSCCMHPTNAHQKQVLLIIRSLSVGGAVPAIVERLLSGLVPALQSGEEMGTLHARRLTTALQAIVNLLSSCKPLCAQHP